MTTSDMTPEAGQSGTPEEVSNVLPEMDGSAPRNACRIVLFCACSRLVGWGEDADALFRDLLEAGDFASVVFYAGDLEQTRMQELLEPVAKVLQQSGVAVLVDGDTRTAGRIGADGLQINAEAHLLESIKQQHGSQMMVGVTNVKGRHNALLLGEGEPDYIMFGKPGADTRPDPHAKNLELGEWWSAIVEIPCIVLGGSVVESVVPVAKAGVEFVGLETAIFGTEEEALSRTLIVDRLRQANQLLDNHAPEFDLAD
ncbi:MAG: thiamine phosphate synthase [Pseudomonadota bacterium]